jgi:hypothetical protein
VGEVRPVTPVPGTRMAEICGLEPFDGFHFCNYGVDLRYRDAFAEAGLTSAFAPDAGVEASSSRPPVLLARCSSRR